MDFYFVKVKVRSKATAEDMLGYFFGKTAKEPEFDFIVVPARYANMLNISIEADYREFLETFKALKNKVLREVPEAVELTDDFMNYLRLQIQRKGPEVFSAELATAVQNNDGELVHVTLTELIKGWTPRSEIAVSMKPMTMEELSMENFLSQMEDLGDENLLEVLTRPDVKDLPEIFPIIDPVYGKPITEFDVGDHIFFVVLNPGSEQYKKSLEAAFPSHFKDGVTQKPFIGTLISKELIVGDKGGKYFLIKVDFGKGIVGKGIVSRSLKLMGDISRFEQKLSRSISDEELFRKVGEVAKKVIEEKQPVPKTITTRKKVITSTTYVQASGIDFIVAFLTTILVVGLVLVISFFFL